MEIKSLLSVVDKNWFRPFALFCALSDVCCLDGSRDFIECNHNWL